MDFVALRFGLTTKLFNLTMAVLYNGNYGEILLKSYLTEVLFAMARKYADNRIK
jgi:hypothetical protein